MPTDQRAALKKIRTFPMLVRYLREEMGWPIGSDDFDDLTFDYTAEELGIDAKNAAKIEEIKRLRPLLPRQPWGIFFVKFERKRLPVVALRRILSQVVVKNRASGNRADRVAWEANDLLFVSNYGEGEERRISFAHFAQNEAKGDLPTLKVLGWDNLDTALHLDDVADKLTHNLAWPEEDDIEGWRKSWRSAFTLRHGEVITTSRDLSFRLAELAQAIRDRIRSALAIETDTGPLTKLLKAFQEALIHDLDAGSFADMYAQTIAYGLLSARVANPKADTADDLPAQLPVTNPFLKELMETFLHVGGRRGKAGGPGIDFDELGVSEVVELLDGANMEAVIRDFGDRNPKEDPVIHFYEHFLAAYDKLQKVQRGVFYTPRPVVSYIVRSVDELLRTELGLADGLADINTWGEMTKRHEGLEIPEDVSADQSFVQILDPATGTGTFLVEVIDTIYRTMKEKWEREAGGPLLADVPKRWNDYVPQHLLPRLHGYELLMAPYAIAHLKIGLKLYETGYRFGSDERARVYLTNALEPPSDKQLRLDFLPALAHEAQAVNEIKRKQRFTVVIGNPPYSNFGKLNRIPFILRLLEDYKSGLEEKKLNLDDDFIKFVRLCQYLVETAGIGIAGLITNSVFLDGVTHRRMREALTTAYSSIHVVDLHGNSKRGEQAPDGLKDENVFEIQQGVAISFSCKFLATGACVTARSDLWGRRESKYTLLATNNNSSTESQVLAPSVPYFFFTARGDNDHRLEYGRGWSTKAIFPINSDGMQTKRDRLTVHFSATEVLEAVQDLKILSDEDLREKYDLPPDGRDWSITWAREDVRKHSGTVVAVEYRPFDWRFTLYTSNSKGFLAYPRHAVSAHLVHQHTLALATNRFIKLDRVAHFLVARSVVDTHLLETANSCLNVSPLYLGSVKSEGLGLNAGGRPNLSRAFLASLSASLSLKASGKYGLPEGVAAEDVFHYGYAVFNSPSYRTRYAEFLKIDFPRLPLPGSLTLFRNLGPLGKELVALHLMESTKSSSSFATPPTPKPASVTRSSATRARRRSAAIPGATPGSR